MKRFFIIKFTSLLVCTSLSLYSTPHQIFFDDFENGSFQPEWVIMPGGSHGVIEIFSGNNNTGGHAVRMGKDTDGDYTINQLDLQLDLSSFQQVLLSFWIFNNNDDTQEQDGIFFSDNGGETFRKVYNFNLSHWAKLVYGKLPPLDVDELAKAHGLNLTKNFVIRFQQYGKSDFNGSADYSDGIYLDNILVETAEANYATLPFKEDFEPGTLGPSISWAMPGHSGMDVLPTPSGLVKVMPSPEGNGLALALGSQVDKTINTNAVDLHLHLAQQQQVALSFRFYSNFDEQHIQDGLFFSDNGGLSFTKVFNFDLDNWSAKVFGQLPPLDVDELAKAHQLSLTENFIIRFQQHDDDDFEGSRTIADGFFLDDIHVFVPRISFATLPFKEDFESGTSSDFITHANPILTAPLQYITPSGFVEVTNRQVIKGKYALALGSRADGNHTVNAMDLFLNLQGEQVIELSFWMYDNYDEKYPEDGIWLSNNGGQSFTKVYQFENYAQRDLQFFNFSLDSLAAAARLTLTHQFIIRFQQCGNRAFDNDGSFRDGIYLDDLLVAKVLPTPSLINYNDGDIYSDPNFTFAWQPVKQATSYQVQVLKGKSLGSSMVVDQVIEKEEYTIAHMHSNTSYLWRVRAINEHKTSPWSVMKEIRTGDFIKAVVDQKTYEDEGINNKVTENFQEEILVAQ